MGSLRHVPRLGGLFRLHLLAILCRASGEIVQAHARIRHQLGRHEPVAVPFPCRLGTAPKAEGPERTVAGVNPITSTVGDRLITPAATEALTRLDRKLYCPFNSSYRDFYPMRWSIEAQYETSEVSEE